MPVFAQALAVLPAIAALVVTVVALADRRDAALLQTIRDLDLGPTSPPTDDDQELESSAA